MTSGKPNRRPVVALIAAGFLMLALGLTHRALPARLLTPVSTTPIDPAALERFPMRIGDWIGEDVPLDETIPRKIDADACVNRRYSRDSRMESVSLFIAASGFTAGNLAGHPPEVCNVLSGSTLVDQRSVELPLGNGMRLECQVLQFVRGDSLDPKKQTVLCYYMADGQNCGNRSVLRSRVRRGSTMVRCVAQVQIVASTEALTPDSRMAMIRSFAADSAPLIARLFEDLKRDQSSSEFCGPVKGK